MYKTSIKKLLPTVVLFAILPFVLFSTSDVKASDNDDVKLILSVDKADYDILGDAIKAENGNVRHKYNNVNAIAVTLPADKAEEICARPEVTGVLKDRVIDLSEPKRMDRAGFGKVPASVEMQATYTDAVSTETLGTLIGNGLNNYFPASTAVTKAFDLFVNNGLTGNGVIIGIMDSGTAEVSSLSGRVLGGESFLPVDPALDDGLGPNDPGNGPHGTWVATCAGANGLFGFGNPAVQNAIKAYCSDCVIPDFFGPGIDGIPMVGQAPGATFYALKIFNIFGQTSNSIIAAAMDRAIELKEKYDNGQPGGVNLRVVNMSFGGASLFAGQDPFFAEMAEILTQKGIVVVASSGNEGPSGMTGGDPGLAENILTVGASSTALEERVVAELFFAGPGGGGIWRPLDNHLMTDFSSRGPTADGRPDPDIVAQGDWRFVQHANGSTINWVGGTSFSSPTVAGVAALLLEAVPSATPDEIRGALLEGANDDLLDGDPSEEQDQGFGFVDAAEALEELLDGAENPEDETIGKKTVAKNIKKGIDAKIIKGNHFSEDVEVEPGEREEFFVEVDRKTRELRVTVSNVTPELPPSQQNQFFGDDLIFAIQSARTSDEGYLVKTFLSSGQTFVFNGDDLEYGIMRVTIMGDWTNVGEVEADISIDKVKGQPDFGSLIANDQIQEGDFKFYGVNVPTGATNMTTRLEWKKDWGAYPTNDIDLILFDPNNNLNFDGATLNSPEAVSIASPTAGVWTLLVNGFTVWGNADEFSMFVDIQVGSIMLAGKLALDKAGVNDIELMPTEFGVNQNYPNPFNPETRIDYALPEQANVTLSIFNVRGQLIRTLVNGSKPAGFYSVTWDATDASGIAVPSGAYFLRIKAGEQFVKTNKMMLVK